MHAPNSPPVSASSAPCTTSPSNSCINAHETIISIDRAGMARSASLRPSRGVITPVDYASTLTTTGATTIPTLTLTSTPNLGGNPPSLPMRSSHPQVGANSRRMSMFTSGFWVSVELFLTLSQILAAIVVLAMSQNEQPETPLPLWVIGYAVGCSGTLPLLYWRYHHRPHADNFLEQGPHLMHHHQSTQWPPPSSTSIPLSHLDPHDPLSSRVYQAIPRVGSIRLELCMERLRMTLDCFFAVWFVLGNVWVFGRPSAAEESPKLYRLCVAFLALSCVSYAMPFVVCAAVCCCLPCLISVLGIGEANGGGAHGNRGAAADTIAALPAFRFRSKRRCPTCKKKGEEKEEEEEKGGADSSSSSDSDCSMEGGVIGAGTQYERVISGDDAACCICLGRYRDNAQLRGLPCSHHFHVECLDQWLKINASCPLCKFSILGGKQYGDIDSDSSTSARRGRRLFEEV